jgi:hypothetical protein
LLQWQRRLHINDGDEAIMMRVTTPAWQWQQCHCNKGNNVIATTAKTPGLQTPSQRGQWCQLVDSKDTCTLMMATTPLLKGQQCQLDNYASLTTAKAPLQQGWQLPLGQLQRINSNNAIATRATMPFQWWQGCLRIDDDNNAIGTKEELYWW